MFALGNATFVRSARERSFEEAHGETEVGRGLLHGAGATPTAAADTPPARKPNPKLNQRPPRALFCLKLDNSCCYVRYSFGNNCNVVVKLVQEYCFFNAFYFRSTETVRKIIGTRDDNGSHFLTRDPRDPSVN